MLLSKKPFRMGRIAGLLAVLALGSAHAGAAELIQNGGFEAGGMMTYAPASWLVNEWGGLGAVAADSAASGLSHASGFAISGPASGNYYGSIDAFTAGAFTLSQSFTTGAVGSASLSFKMFVNDQSADGQPRVAANLDWEAANNAGSEIAYARVDVLKAGADAYATGSDVVKSLYIGGATGPNAHPSFNDFASYSFDLSDVLAAGGTYTLRFALATNVAQMQMGVDDVSLQVTAVPEPDTMAMLFAGLGLLSVVARRRRNTSAV